MAAIDVGVKFSIEKLDQIVDGFNKVIEGMDFGKGFELEKETIKAQFDIVKNQLAEALKTGELNVQSLNLPGLVRALESVAKQGASALGTELNDKALEPFKAELETIGNAIDKEANKLKDITSQRKALTDESVKKQTKEETGGSVSRVMFSSMAEAETYLNKLKEAEKEEPGANEKRTQLITFYKAYVTNLKKAEKARQKLNKEEALIKEGIGKLKAQEEGLLLKIKKESASIDSKAPANIKQILQLTSQLREVYEKLRKTQKESNDERKKEIEGTNKATEANEGESKSLASKAISAGLYYAAINAVKRIMRETIQVVTELDKAMTEAAIVTNMNRKEAWQLLGAYQNLAKETGVAVSEISGVVVEFLRQGRSLKEAMELAEVAAKSAKVAAISTSDAVKYLTSAVNGFGLAASQAEEIGDRFANIAANSASSFEELAVAMSKVAPVAKSAGVGIDFMMGVLAKGLETTREAPENIGTAFKTIFARMREVTDMGKATEDGMSLNRVEKALASINVPLRDVSGQFRNLEDVLVDVGNKWDKLNSIEQAYLATALAGTRQQPRLLAIFNDFTRTKELIEISSDSIGALQFQHMDYMEGMEASMNRLKNAWQGFIMALTESDIIIDIINLITFVIDQLTKGIQALSSPLGYTVTLLTAFGVVMTMVLAKTLLQTKAAIINAAANAVNALVYKGVKDNLRGVNTMTFKNIVLTYKKIAADKAAKASSSGLAFANKNLGKSFLILAAKIWVALVPLLPFIAAALLVIGAIAGVVYLLHEAGKGAEYYGKEIQKVNKELNDLNKSAENTKKLTDRFKELQKITHKTAEDIEEMQKISEELGEMKLTVDGKEQTYNMTSVDFTGESTFNEAEYKRYLEDVNKERERLNTEARKAFDEAIKKDGMKALDDPNVANYVRKMGYDAGVAFADSLGKGFSEETKTKIKKQIAESLKKMDMKVFAKQQYKVGGKIYDSLAEAEAAQAEMVRRGTGLLFNARTIVPLQTGEIDEERLKEFTEKLTNIYANGSQLLQNRLDEINKNSALTQEERTKATLNATMDSYTSQIEEAKRTLTGEDLEMALSFIGQNNVDGAILNTLINERRIEIDLIANLRMSGMSAQEIQTFLNGFETPGLTQRSGETDASFQARKDQRLEGVRSAVTTATSGGAANITAGFADFRAQLQALGYTPEQIEEEVRKLGEVVQTLSAEQVGNLIKSQSELTKKAMDLSAKIGKGDFSDFGEIVAEYGLDAATDILNGSEAGIRAVMEKNREKTMDEIAASMAEIYAIEGVDTFDQLSDAAKEQVRTLELMRDYYDDIVGFEMLREFRMKQITGYMKEMNDLLKLQESLMNLGMAGDSPFVQTLDAMVGSLDRLARAKIDKQLKDDLKNLERFGTFDGEGNFIVNPDIDITQADQAIEAAMSTLTTYVQMQTDAFNRQKKAIEEASKAEIDAAKKSFDEKWRSIEYSDKLAEAENKIFEARRKLAAFSISGLGKGQIAAAESELRKMEQERRKMVEQQALEQVQKELEAERDDAIAFAQRQMTEAIEQYTAQLVEVLPQLTDKLEELIVALDDNTAATEDPPPPPPPPAPPEPTTTPTTTPGRGRGDLTFIY